MTIRQLGAALIKLMGVYFAATGFLVAARVVASLLPPGVQMPEGFPTARQMLVGNLVPAAADALVAAVCILRGDALAGTMFNAGSHQALFAPAMERSYESLIDNVVEIMIGWALVLRAKRLAVVLGGTPAPEN